MHIDFVLLLVLKLVELLSSSVKILDISTHSTIIHWYMMHFPDSIFLKPSPDIPRVVISLLMVLISLNV
jgi:hypothetical protein